LYLSSAVEVFGAVARHFAAAVFGVVARLHGAAAPWSRAAALSDGVARPFGGVLEITGGDPAVPSPQERRLGS
jgi:hypothetical protein